MTVKYRKEVPMHNNKKKLVRSLAAMLLALAMALPLTACQV